MRPTTAVAEVSHRRRSTRRTGGHDQELRLPCDFGEPNVEQPLGRRFGIGVTVHGDDLGKSEVGWAHNITDATSELRHRARRAVRKKSSESN